MHNCLVNHALAHLTQRTGNHGAIPLDRLMPRNVILATNTAGLTSQRLANARNTVVGLRVKVMSLVEFVPEIEK